MKKQKNLMKNINGINILGYINKQFGLGEGVRCNIRAIKAAQIPYVLNDHKGKSASGIMEESTPEYTIVNESPYPINLIQINLESFNDLLQHQPADYFQGKYNIGFWAWELEKFPANYQHIMNLLDEIWVPSNFCLNAISQVCNRPVLRFLHSISISPNAYTKTDFNLPIDKTIYLTIFDYNSSIVRKNPIATIEAFEMAFGLNNPDVLLVIKTSASTSFPDQHQELQQRIAANSSIIMINEVLSREKLEGLMQACDVYVSLHRSEGFGLTLAEAMHLGKAVIGTAYSANTEFMQADNSFLIPYTLIPTGANYLYPDLNNVWADPNVEDAARAMKQLHTDPNLRKKISEKAHQYAKTHLSPETIGKKIKSRIDFIYETKVPSLQNKSGDASFQLQTENILLIEKLKAIKRIKMVRWKLALKRLTNKLSGKQKKFFWED